MSMFTLTDARTAVHPHRCRRDEGQGAHRGRGQPRAGAARRRAPRRLLRLQLRDVLRHRRRRRRRQVRATAACRSSSTRPSAQHLGGAPLDYKDGLQGAGFAHQQPERAAHLRLRPVVQLTARSRFTPRRRAASSVDIADGDSRCCRCLRERLRITIGQGRLRAPGPVRLLHGARRRRRPRRVRDAGRRGRRPRRSPRSTGSTRRHARRARSTRSSRPAGRSAASARRGSSCARRAARGAGPVAPTSTARSPRTCAAAPAGRPIYDAIDRRRRSAERIDGRRQSGATSTPRRGGPRSRAASRSASAPTVPLGRRRVRRRHRARATRSSRSRCPPGSAAEPSRPPGVRLGRRRVAARGPRPRGQGAGPAHDGRRRRRRSTAARRARRRGARSRRSWVEPAYLEPDASWCEPGRRAGVAARQRRRVRRQGRSRPRPAAAARARRRARSRGARRLRRAKTSCGSGPKRPPIAATRGVCATAASRSTARRAGRRPPAYGVPPYALEVDARWDDGRPLPGPPVGADCARPGSRSRRVLVEGALDAAGVDRATLVDDAARRCCSTHCAVGRRRVAGARVEVDARPARSTASTCASRPAIRSTRSCCARTRSAPRTWRSGWVLTEGLAVDPDDRRGARPHDPLVRHHPRRGRCRRSTSTIVDDPGPPRRASSDAVFAAVAAATWNALTAPKAPTRYVSRRGRTRAARMLRPMTVEPVPTPSAPPVAGPYSPAVRAGDWLVLAGQVGLDPATGAHRRRRRRGAGPPGARQHRGGARRLRRVAHRRRQDHGVRHRHRATSRP